uniref:Uncharacterized protein n=1 Tax=Rhizophora mucronata TaxID=61149 RepID=A0A2P2NRQ9_RHIMU
MFIPLHLIDPIFYSTFRHPKALLLKQEHKLLTFQSTKGTKKLRKR